MRLILLLVALCLVLPGCSSSPDSLSKKALELYLAQNYNGTGSVESIKVLDSQLVNTDMNAKHYRCEGKIKIKFTADAPYPSRTGVIQPGESYYKIVGVRLKFMQGSTGAIEIESFNENHINSKDGSEG